MPLPIVKLQRVPTLPGSKKCRTCNNLTPEDHERTVIDDIPSAPASSSKKRKRSSQDLRKPGSIRLDLPLDLRALRRANDKLEREQCRFCNVLVQALDEFLPAQKKWKGDIWMELSWKRPVRLIVDADAPDGIVEIYAQDVNDLPWFALGSARDIPANPASKESIVWINSMLDTCSTSHVSGHKSHRERLVSCKSSAICVPACKRLLEIDKSKQFVRLVKSPKTLTKYVALSHCWGDHLPLTTTSETLKQRVKKIDIGDLPLLYQDAVKLCIKTDVGYIWIDSLCIIQDQYRDWAEESSKMADVYADAYYTIAATEAADSTQQILVERRHNKGIIYKNTKGKEFTICARLTSNHQPQGHFLNRRGVPGEIRGLLTTRAWTLQEHLMSSRIFHFTAVDVIFECPNGFGCQCSPQMSTCTHEDTVTFLPRFKTQKRHQQHQAWQSLVEKYTLRKLTRAGDKLAALSGLAQRCQAILDDDYLAGLWKENLAEDLLWASAPWLENPHETPIPIVAREPSWSWASLDTQIRYEESPPKSCRHLVSLKGAKINIDKVNQFGSVGPRSWLRIKGCLIPGMLIGPEKYDFHYALKVHGLPPIQVFPDCILKTDDEVDENYDQAIVRRARAGEVYSSFKASVLCLAVTCDKEQGIITGLVLGRPNQQSSLSTQKPADLTAFGRAASAISRALGFERSDVDTEVGIPDDVPRYERLGLFSCGDGRVFTDAKATEFIFV